MTANTPQNQDKFVLRLPDGMRDRIKRAAEANGRSMNSEILAVLQEHYPEPPLFVDIDEQLNELVARIIDEPDRETRRALFADFEAEIGTILNLGPSISVVREKD